MAIGLKPATVERFGSEARSTCPVCQAKMTEFQPSTPERMHGYSCPQCHGMFYLQEASVEGKPLSELFREHAPVINVREVLCSCTGCGEPLRNGERMICARCSPRECLWCGTLLADNDPFGFCMQCSVQGLRPEREKKRRSCGDS